MLDRLPAWARHILIAFGSAFGGSIVADVLAAHGVTGLDIAQTAQDAVDFAAASAASAAAALWSLPLTRQYGVGKATADPDLEA